MGSSLPLPVWWRVGSFIAKTTAMVMMTTSIHYGYYVLDGILTQRTLHASLHLTLSTTGYDRICVLFAFHR